MNQLLNIGLSVALGIFIIASAYFIKMDSKNKIVEQKTPTFVSLKFAQTNLRTGPSTDYPIIYTYNQPQMPLKIMDSHEDWYQIMDIYGQKGWLYKNLVNTQRFAIVVAKSNIYLNTGKNKILAIIGEFNIVKILSCDTQLNLCKIEFSAGNNNAPFVGYINQDNLWGDTGSSS
ncbi:MAG: SH3 domain-containing protein [Alphaproteobacteria bacterium]|jgi:SH3-like domain-containing protein|nr:SH3 domain-containing protein [Alphaproteobacteria bacterium]